MTRIVSGTHGGRRLEVPASGTRPTSERVREALFSRLESWGELHEARVIDLYSGSGALGLEALSRGAKLAVLVDSAPAAIRSLRKNVERNGFRHAEVVRADAAKFATVHDFTLAFLDPPYDIDVKQLMQVLAHLEQFLVTGALVVVELSARVGEPEWPDRFFRESMKKWGDTTVWFLTFGERAGSVEL